MRHLCRWNYGFIALITSSILALLGMLIPLPLRNFVSDTLFFLVSEGTFALGLLVGCSFSWFKGWRVRGRTIKGREAMLWVLSLLCALGMVLYVCSFIRSPTENFFAPTTIVFLVPALLMLFVEVVVWIKTQLFFIYLWWVIRRGKR